MGWGSYSSQGNNGRQKNTDGYVTEGNAKVFLFTSTPVRCQFLTEDVQVEEVMQKYGLIKEEAQSKIMTDIANERWLMPKPYWVHSIPAIPNSRFFAKSVCLGRDCPMCDENAPHKENGVENKNLPYRVSKVYYVPAYFYDLNQVLFVKGSEGFFDEIAKYVDKNGADCDFEIYSDGKGLDTRYKSTFCGAAQFSKDSILEAGHASTYPMPFEFDPRDDEAELVRKLTGGKREGTARPNPTAEAAARAPAPSATAPTPRNETVRPSASVPAPASAGATTTTAPTPTNAQPTVPRPIASAPSPNSSGHTPSATSTNAAADDPGAFTVQFGAEKGKTLAQIHAEGKSNIIKFYSKNSAGELKDAAIKFCLAMGIK